MTVEPRRSGCRHEDPDNTGQCIRCGFIWDSTDPDYQEVSKPVAIPEGACTKCGGYGWRIIEQAPGSMPCAHCQGTDSVTPDEQSQNPSA